MTQHYRLVLVGFGNVGRAFTRLLLKKEQELKKDCDVSFCVTGISTGKHGQAIDTAGIDLERALIMVEKGKSLNVLSQEPFAGDSTAFIRACPGDVLFETIFLNDIECIHEAGLIWDRGAGGDHVKRIAHNI